MNKVPISSSKKQIDRPPYVGNGQSVENFNSLTQNPGIVSKSGESGEIIRQVNQEIR